MHAPVTVGRGVWGAMANAVCLRERYNFPNWLGWGPGLGPGRQARLWPGIPSIRAGGAVQGPPAVSEGRGVRNRVVRGYRDGVDRWSKKVFAPMTWGALSEARRVPPQETVADMAVIIVPAAAIQANTTLIHTIQVHTDDTCDTVICMQYRHTYNGQPAKNTLLDLGARALRQSLLPKKSYLHILSKIHTNEYIHIHAIHAHTYT